MAMKISFTIFFLISFLAIPTPAQEHICKPVRCSDGGPDISFPFYLNGQSRDCGVLGFGLICRSNSTVIKLPSYGDLAVKSTSYRDKRLNLVDPRSCIHEVFLNLNLSRTPFKYYYSLKSYTYINCSEPAVPLKYSSSPEIPCLSGPGYHVYTVESYLASSVVASGDRSSTCRAVKTVKIPFAYSPYLSDSSFGLRLTWESTDSCGGCNERSHRALTITIVVVAIMAALVWVKIHNSKKQGVDEHVLHAKKLLGDNKTQAYTTGLV